MIVCDDHVCDQQELSRDPLERRLRREGFELLRARSGTEVFEKLDRTRPGHVPVDLVLLGALMGDQNRDHGGPREESGLDVLRRIRERHPPTELPVVMLTAHDHTQDVVEALQLGANDYLSQPVNFPVMLARLATQVQSLRTSRALRESEERYMLAARGSNDGLWDWDLAANSVFYSSRWKQMLGYMDDEIASSPDEWFSRVHTDDVERVRAELENHWLGGQVFESEHRIRHRSGSHRWVLCRGAAVRDASGRPCRMAGSLTDLTPSKVSDPLTGLPNRLMFQEKLEACLSRCRQDGGYHFALLFIDLDSFKTVNDSLGHGVGDQLLLGVAHRLREAVRADDIVVRAPAVAARFGGDEFAVLIDNIAGPPEAQRVAERMIERFGEPYRLGDHEIHVGVSIGIAVGSADYRDAADILRDADTAMYRAKALGKARAAVFTTAMHDAVLARLQIENEMRRALERGQFSLHYQAIHALSPRRLVGFEALIRWRHPSRGNIGPAVFIPIAEETGAIIPIGHWVLREACRQLKAWQRAFPSQPPLAMSVNVSARQLHRDEFPDEVRGVLEEHQLEPGSLRLEITETTLMDDADGVIRILRQLKRLGVGLQIDDFGTGYSSLTYVDRFPVDTVKIDRSFVCDLPGNKEHAGIVQAVLILAESLGMVVTAEGVETSEQLRHLESINCQLAQGYYFSRPLPASEAERLLGGDAGRRGVLAA